MIPRAGGPESSSQKTMPCFAIQSNGSSRRTTTWSERLLTAGVAVELAEELRPDVVLLDISMPVMTGFEAARLIRERLPEVRVIIVSNYTSAVHIDEAFQIGAHGYVDKGSAAFQLRQAIEGALNGKVFRPA